MEQNQPTTNHQAHQDDSSSSTHQQHLNHNGISYRNSLLQQPTAYPQPSLINNGQFYHPLHPPTTMMQQQQGFSSFNNFNLPIPYPLQPPVMLYPYNSNTSNYPPTSGLMGSHPHHQLFFPPNPFNQIPQNVPQPNPQQQPQLALSKPLSNNTLEEENNLMHSTLQQKTILSASEQLIVESIKLYQLQNQLYLNQVSHAKDYEYHLLKVSNDLENIKSLHEEVKELKEEIAKLTRKKNKLLKKTNLVDEETKMDEENDQQESLEDAQLDEKVTKLLNGNYEAMKTTRHYGLAFQNSSFLLNSGQNSNNIPIIYNSMQGVTATTNNHQQPLTDANVIMNDRVRSPPVAATTTSLPSSVRTDPPPQISSILSNSNIATTTNVHNNNNNHNTTETTASTHDEPLRNGDSHHDSPAISITNSSLRFTSSTTHHHGTVESIATTTNSVLEKRSRTNDTSSSVLKKKKVIEEIVEVEDQNDSYETKFPLCYSNEKKQEIEKQKKQHLKNRYKDEEYLVLPKPTQPLSVHREEEEHQENEQDITIEKSPTLHRPPLVVNLVEDGGHSLVGDDILYMSLGLGGNKKMKQEEKEQQPNTTVPSPSLNNRVHASNSASKVGASSSPPNYTNLTTMRVHSNKPTCTSSSHEKNTPTGSKQAIASPLMTSSHLNSEDEEEYSKYFKSPKHKKRHATPGHDYSSGSFSSKSLSKQPPSSLPFNTSPPLLVSTAPPTPPHYWDLNSIEETQESHSKESELAKDTTKALPSTNHRIEEDEEEAFSKSY
ncbi:hypothetical protein FDP41_008080 [Naegleria fowleri]|uniref:Uncharacterized protein n=1 Tax=Naegleria fowleri TaxID=5763 RepID=A0A6A5B461_NAEFO|nr:uncharacterized protein FDP41_008080 [Naegleria fowleri]KAF0973653.1 hypothetical protein FDP41_008080 [Naegleria fowleri]